MEKESFMLTTVDNPFNPFTNFDEWFEFDKEKGYGTCEYLARIVPYFDDGSESEKKAALEKGIDTIIEADDLGLYMKVKKDSTIIPIIPEFKKNVETYGQ